MGNKQRKREESAAPAKGSSGWMLVYDFLDDILGSIIPGAFFVTFCVLLGLAFFDAAVLARIAMVSSLALTAGALVFSYCFGTLFRRSEIKYVDQKSGLHLYTRKSRHISGSPFPFARSLNDAYYEELMKRFSEACGKKTGSENENGTGAKAANANAVNSRRGDESAPGSAQQVKHTIQRGDFSKKPPMEEGRLLKWIRALGRRVSYAIHKKNPPPDKIKKAEADLYNRIINHLNKYMQRDHPSRGQLNNGFFYPFLTRRYKALRKARKYLDGYISFLTVTNPEDDKIQPLRALLSFVDEDLYCKVEFPYGNFSAYLNYRGLTSLARHVDWGWKENAFGNRQSKMLINTMKIRILDKAPRFQLMFSKNEAHIRFMNSMWYAGRAIRWCCVPLGCASLVFMALNFLDFPREPAEIFTHALRRFFYASQSGSTSFRVAMVCAIFLAVSGLVTRSVKNILHYQRTREIVAILEAYDIAFPGKTKEPAREANIRDLSAAQGNGAMGVLGEPAVEERVQGRSE